MIKLREHQIDYGMDMEDFLLYVYEMRGDVREMTVDFIFFEKVIKYFYESGNTIIFNYDPAKDAREIQIFGVMVKRIAR